MELWSAPAEIAVVDLFTLSASLTFVDSTHLNSRYAVQHLHIDDLGLAPQYFL